MKIQIPEVGPVLFERSSRARRILIIVKPDGNVRVAVPNGAAFRQAEKLVRSKSGWIAQCRRKLASRPQNPLRMSLAELEIDSEQAVLYLKSRLQFLAEKYGYRYRQVKFRAQKTIWGSCSAGNDISLNIKLVLLPNDLIDYVLLHELVHTVHKNHGPGFYRELDSLVGDSRLLRRKLRNHRFPPVRASREK